jgi:twinkle protein
MPIPVGTNSKAEDFIKRMGWSSRPGSTDQLVVQTCPFCSDSAGKFAINVSAGDHDGLWQCFRCQEKGNLHQLKERVGVRTAGVTSMQDAAEARHAPSPLPNFDALHKNLMNNEAFGDVLDYLLVDRGFTFDVIERLKIGAKDDGEKKWFIIPYFDATGNPTYFKARTVPPAKKAFDSPHGREAGLFNQPVIKAGMEELVLVEGECDCISLLCRGYGTVCGVPGAGVKKAAWIELLDRHQPKNVYLLYDNDKPGQDGAREMAARVGIEKVKNIILPPFEVTTADGVRPGKDINDWFVAGHTLDELRQLMADARPFDVEGVYGLTAALDELRMDIEGHGVEPKYKTGYPSLDAKLGGFEDGDLIGVLAEGKVGKTTTVLNIVQKMIETYNETGFVFCQEMLPKRMVRKWVSMVTKTDDTPGKSQMSVEKISEALDYAQTMKGDILFGYTKSLKAEDVTNTIRQAVRRYGAKFVVFDNLHMLPQSVQNQAAEISKITKAFKQLAMELKIVLFLIMQPRKTQGDQMVTANDINGSSGPSKDVDYLIVFHRKRVGNLSDKQLNGYMETDEGFEPQLYVKVDLARYASGGMCTLWFDGATSTVRELSQDDVAAMPVPATGAIPVGDAVAV